MKRLLTLTIIFIFVLTSLSATAAWISTGNPSMTGPSAMDVVLYYDPELMQRISFGFSNQRNIDWYGPTDNIVDTGIYLETQYPPELEGSARGYGAVNFYWILRTDLPVTANLYLDSPMLDLNTKDSLDWSIVFDSQIENLISHNVTINSKYGIENSVPIFKRLVTPEINVEMDSLPVEIITDYSETTEEAKMYSGSIGVIVEII